MPEQPIVVCLGRYGDICNALPIAYELFRGGKRPLFVVSSQFWTILEGVSYVDIRSWEKDYKELPYAIKRCEGREAYICQAYMHPDQKRLTDSYQKEAWRLAGWLPRFGLLPLVFDKRDREREAELVKLIGHTPQKKTILVSSKSISSPFKSDLLVTISDAFRDCNVVDIGLLTATKIYDLIGLMDVASCLVSVDTVHLHLARATDVPTVAIINNGWYGSCLTTTGKHKFIRYNDYNADLVVKSIKSIIR